jgi:sugar O-acyltransferase (sialic acid O-acetyltransferase NeuD family)
MILKNSVIKKKNIAILGAGGHGKVIGDIAFLNGFSKIDFFDDNYLDVKNFPFKVIGKLDEFEKLHHKYSFWFISIGDNSVRKKIFLRFRKLKKNLINLIHPSSIISQFSKIDRGVSIMANVVINAGSKIKTGAIINSSASIDHDCNIGEFAHIAPNVTLCGDVLIGNDTLVGAGSTVHPGIKVGKNVKVGIGSKIFRNVKNKSIHKE